MTHLEVVPDHPLDDEDKAHILLDMFEEVFVHFINAEPEVLESFGEVVFRLSIEDGENVYDRFDSLPDEVKTDLLEQLKKAVLS